MNTTNFLEEVPGDWLGGNFGNGRNNTSPVPSAMIIGGVVDDYLILYPVPKFSLPPMIQETTQLYINPNNFNVMSWIFHPFY